MIKTTFLPNINCPEIIGTSRDFGALRDNGKRLHAGIDLYAPIGTNVIFDLGKDSSGMVMRPYELFFRESYSIAIYSFLHNITIRFCEISKPFKLFKVNDLIKQGDIIGHVADLDLKNAMLHLEIYLGMQTRFGSNKTAYKRVNNLVSPWACQKLFIKE